MRYELSPNYVPVPFASKSGVMSPHSSYGSDAYGLLSVHSSASPSTRITTQSTSLQSRSVCVCVYRTHEHISETAGPIFTKFCVQTSCGRGSVLLRRRCSMLCTSGFTDDVMFGCNGRDAKRWQPTRVKSILQTVAI